MEDKTEQTKMLEDEKVALDKRVRDLAFKLEVRAEDLSKKEVGSTLSCGVLVHAMGSCIE